MELSYKQAIYRAAALCTKSEHCESDIKKKLKDWNINDSDTQKIIFYLKEEKYIDHLRYCKFFVKDKMQFNKWGKKKIILALQIKGINSDIIKTVFNNIDENKYLELLNNIIKNKNKNLSFKNEYDHKQKLIRFAVSRGFSINLVIKSVENILKNNI